MPYNLEAEIAVLGSMLISKEAANSVIESLNVADFYRQSHQIIFKTINDLINSNEAADIVTVTNMLRKQNTLDKIGGITFLTSVANSVLTAANVNSHINIIKENSRIRKIINAATEVAALGYQNDKSADEISDQAEKLMMAATNIDSSSNNITPMKALMMDALDKVNIMANSKGQLLGLSTGFLDMDKLTSGLQPSDLILVAARPSMGKTAFTLNITTHAAIKKKEPVAFFSLEMSKEQLVQRMLCAEGALDSQRVRNGELSEQDWQNLINAASKLSSSPIYIDDTAGISIMELRSKARRIKMEHGLSLIIIDYLQLMQGNSNKRNDNRQQEISEISRGLKALARELEVPVIALSQLSRTVESRQSKKPMLSDLRESGSLEQDADIVMFLYREDYYDPNTENKNITDVIIAKHRNGPIDTVQLYFEKASTRFFSLNHQKAS